MLFRGALDAIMMWVQQSLSVGASHGYLTGPHFQQIFTAHGDIMVFFATMGFLVGLMNLVVPLQIGARDLASPLLNTLGFWLYVAGAILMNMFFVFGGEFAAAGWLAQTPLSELQYSPGVGVDYWIWSLQISGLGSLMAGINFLATIIKMRSPRDDTDANAGFYLGDPLQQCIAHNRISYFGNRYIYVDARPLYRYSFLYYRERRKPNDVY